MQSNFAYVPYASLASSGSPVFAPPPPGLQVSCARRSAPDSATNLSLYLQPQVRVERRGADIGGARIESAFTSDSLALSYSVSTRNGLHFDSLAINSSVALGESVRCALALQRSDAWSFELSDEFAWRGRCGARLSVRSAGDIGQIALCAETGASYRGALFAGARAERVLGGGGASLGLVLGASLGFAQLRIAHSRGGGAALSRASLLLLLSERLTAELQCERSDERALGCGFAYSCGANRVRATALTGGLVNATFSRQLGPGVAASASLAASLQPLSCSPGLLLEIEV